MIAGDCQIVCLLRVGEDEMYARGHDGGEWVNEMGFGGVWRGFGERIEG
jgi:hypothetical protein